MDILQQGEIAGADYQKHVGGSAETNNGYAFWVRGRGKVLKSFGFGSCVGLVLAGDVDGYGAVVHFWNPAGVEDAAKITKQYMQYLYEETGGYCGDDVEAVVFGGTNYGTLLGAKITVPRVEAIRAHLKDRWDMRVVVPPTGFSSVSLNLNVSGPIEKLVTLDETPLDQALVKTTNAKSLINTMI